MKILVSGAGIAGPTLAYWLQRHGFTPTLLEEAKTLRDSGYVIDFWGYGFDIAERMGVLPQVLSLGYRVREVRLVDAQGDRVGGFSVDVFERLTQGRYISLPRGDLARILYSSLENRVETIFGERLADLVCTDTHVQAKFIKMPPRDFDLVIGADGLHSMVRTLAFDPSPKLENYLGYRVVAFETAGYRPRNELVYVSYSEPGLQAARFAMRDDRTLFLLVYADPDRRTPRDARAQRREIHARFDTAGWECQRIMAEMDKCSSIYFDRASQIRMSKWSTGRVALVGDAAAAPSLLAGQGAALAMIEAYILAGELARSPHDHAGAFARYEARLKPFIASKQHAAKKFAGSFAPRTRIGLLVRNLFTQAMSLPFVAELTIGSQIRDSIDLPSYELVQDAA